MYLRPALNGICVNVEAARQQEHLILEMQKLANVEDKEVEFRDIISLNEISWKYPNSTVYVLKNTSMDMPLRIRERSNRREKQMIARAVARLVEEGDSIMLDASSTSLMISKELKEMNNLTVVTNSVEVLIEFAGHEGIRVISTGGTLRDSSLSLVGTAAQKVLHGYNVDKAVISCKGIHMDKGVTDSSEVEADMKNAMRSCARQTILAVDSSKFNQVSFVRFMELGEGDMVVTDCKVDEEWRQFLEERGVQVFTGEELEEPGE